MQVGLDHQVNLCSPRAQSVFGNAFTVPKIEDFQKNTVTKPAVTEKEVKTDEFALTSKQEDAKANTPKVNNETNNEQPKKSKGLKEGIAGIWKFFASADQMVNATIKGVVYGIATGLALLGGSWLFKSLPNAFAKEGPGLWNTIRHPLKNIGKSGKIIAGIGSALVLGYHIVKGKLDTNQRTAVIDHKMKTGHRS